MTDDQTKATNAFLDFMVSDENFFVIQGAAGTGKSFLIKYLLETFYSRYQSYCLLLQKDVEIFNVKVTATTNKAVSVINEFLQGSPMRVDTSTIYSLLSLRIENNYNTGETKLSFNKNGKSSDIFSDGRLLVFIDEASFIGEDLQEVIQTILVNEHDAKIIYVGDKYQLAPVGQLNSVMEDVQCSKVSLDKIIRNQGHILATGTQFRNTVETGTFTDIQYNNSDVIHVDGPTFQQLVDTHFRDPKWNPNKCKILAWTNEQVQAYNKHIRQALHLPEAFQSGDIVITNNFIQGHKSYTKSVDSTVTITNIDKAVQKMYGIEGYMVEIDQSHIAFMPKSLSEYKSLLRELANDKEWRKYFEVKDTWLDLRAAYASSVHKAQGSTYETVFLDLPDIGRNWNAYDVARLLYVGITRASTQVICYGYLPRRYC